MCKSNCQGTCFLSLKNTAIDSKESLTEMINTLNKMRGCASSGKLNKPGNVDPVNEITNLNKATEELMTDIDHTIGTTHNMHSHGPTGDIPKEQSFHERLTAIKDAISLLETTSLRP